MQNKLKKKNLLFSTALATSSLIGGYYQRANAACNGSGGTYTCSGGLVVNNSAITISANDAIVSTLSGFGVRSETNNHALRIVGDGDLSFTDTYASRLTTTGSGADGLKIISEAGGSITINSNSIISSDADGIYAKVEGAAGATTNITFSGNILSSNDGIYLEMYDGYGLAEINTSADSIIKADTDGIDLELESGFTGSVEINHRGYILAVDRGIEITQYSNDQDITINTFAGSSIKSTADSGINFYMGNYSDNSSATLNLNGRIDASFSGFSLEISDGSNNLDLSVTTGSTSVINAALHGIEISLHDDIDDFDVNMTIGGKITASQNGISSANYSIGGNEFNITTTSDSIINAGNHGILLNDIAAEEATFNIYGDITASGKGLEMEGFADNIEINFTGSINSSSDGIHIDNYDAQNINVVVSRSGVINSGNNAINIYNYNYSNSSDISIDVAGNLNGTSTGLEIDGSFDTIDINVTGNIRGDLASGIFLAASSNDDITLTIENGGSATGFRGIYSSTSSNLELVLDGTSGVVTLSGTGGNSLLASDGDDNITISGDVIINGDFVLGSGDNHLTLNNANLTTTQYTDFKDLDDTYVSGRNTVNGNLDLNGSDIIIEENGSLIISGSFDAGVLNISQGATLSANYTHASEVLFGDNSTLKVTSGSAGLSKLVATNDIDIGAGVTLNVSSANFSSGSGVILETINGNINGSFASVVDDKHSASVIYNNGDADTLSLIHFNSGALNAQVQSSLNSSILFSDSLTSQLADSAFTDKDRNFWFKALYRGQDSDTSISNLGIKNQSHGFALGGETNVENSNYKLGFSLAEISSRSDLADQKGSRNSDSIFASIYGTYAKDLTSNFKFFSSLSLGFGYHDNDNKRLVTNEGVSSYAASKSNDTELNATLQAGFKTNLKEGFYITPKASVSYIETHAGSMNEFNGGDAQVSLDKNVYKNLKTREAIRFGHNNTLNLSGVKISPYLEIGLSQERSLGGRNVTGRFFTGDKFDITLANNDRNFVTSVIGANAEVTPRITAFINLENAKSSREERNDAKAGLIVKF